MFAILAFLSEIGLIGFIIHPDKIVTVQSDTADNLIYPKVLKYWDT